MSCVSLMSKAVQVILFYRINLDFELLWLSISFVLSHAAKESICKAIFRLLMAQLGILPSPFPDATRLPLTSRSYSCSPSHPQTPE